MYDQGEARYASGNHDYEDVEYWLSCIDGFLSKHGVYGRLLSNSQDPELHQPLKRSFCYVGLSNNPMARASRHWTHAGAESIVFGLFTATIQHLFPDQFNVQQSTYQILRSTARDEIGLGEIICTILCSSAGWDLGLNIDHPGKQVGSNTEHSTAYDNDLAANLAVIQANGNVDRNIEEANKKVARWKSMFPTYEQLQRHHSTISNAINENKEMADNLLNQYKRTVIANDLARLRRARANYESYLAKQRQSG